MSLTLVQRNASAGPSGSGPTTSGPSDLGTEHGLQTGEQIDIVDLAKGPALVNFFYSSCAPCVAELPLLEEAFEKQAKEGDAGINFIGVDHGETAKSAKVFAERFSLKFSLAADPSGVLASKLGVNVFPTTVFIDSRGFVVGRHVGALSKSALETYLSSFPKPVNKSNPSLSRLPLHSRTQTKGL